MLVFSQLTVLNCGMRFILFTITLLNLISCEQKLSDFSGSQIRYRVVALPGTPTPPRRVLIEAQLKALNDSISVTNAINNAAQQTAVDFGFIDAILGKTLNTQQLIAEGYYTGSLSPAELGLMKTTTDFVIPEAMSMASNEIMVAFEDDVIFRIVLDFSFRQALRQVPDDWDMLFLGCHDGTLTKNGGLTSPFTPFNISIANGVDYRICPQDSLVSVPGTPWRTITMACNPTTYAYAVRATSAKKLNDLLNSAKPFSKPIDLTYNQFFNTRVKAYCLEHELVSTNYALPSTIR